MYLTNEEFNAIKEALNLLPKGNKFACLSEENQKTITKARVVIANIEER